MTRDQRTLDRIAAILSGQEWDSDTPCAIASVLRDAGYDIRELGEDGEDDTAEDLGPAVRQTVCRHCGQDIEGIAPFPAGEWRDRGNNWHCPNAAGDAGQRHDPITD